MKIGFTKNDDASKRLSDLQTGSPFELALMAQFRGDTTQERQAHAILSAHRVTGEWFSGCEALADLVCRKPGNGLSRWLAKWTWSLDTGSARDTVVRLDAERVRRAIRGHWTEKRWNAAFRHLMGAKSPHLAELVFDVVAEVGGFPKWANRKIANRRLSPASFAERRSDHWSACAGLEEEVRAVQWRVRQITGYQFRSAAKARDHYERTARVDDHGENAKPNGWPVLWTEAA
jgi:hypothetical protein